MTVLGVIESIDEQGGQRVIAHLAPGVNIFEALGIDQNQRIVFNLSTWKGPSTPYQNQIVLLERIEKMEDGWIANSARPARRKRNHNA